MILNYYRKFLMKKFTHTILLIALIAPLMCTANNKIIYFISTPRSLSTAFMRMMQTRGDFTLFHEPSMYIFLSKLYPEIKKDFRPTTAQNFDEVQARVYTAAETNNVFVKEMAIVAKELILDQSEFLSDPDIYFVLMVRSPHSIAISFYNKLKEIPPLFADQIGSKTIYELLHGLKGKTAHDPYLILTEELYNNPEETIRRFCNHVGIPFDPKSLTWDDLGSDFNGIQEWHESKLVELTQYWHDNAIHSTGFGKPASYKLDSQGQPTFEEITNPKHRQLCIEAYQENLPYYQMLVEKYHQQKS